MEVLIVFYFFLLKLIFLSDDNNATEINNAKFRTPILRKRWYEIGVLSIRILNSTKVLNSTVAPDANKNDVNINIEQCLEINVEKSIVDSGTTSIRMPDSIFQQVISSHFYFIQSYIMMSLKDVSKLN